VLRDSAAAAAHEPRRRALAQLLDGPRPDVLGARAVAEVQVDVRCGQHLRELRFRRRAVLQRPVAREAADQRAYGGFGVR